MNGWTITLTYSTASVGFNKAISGTNAVCMVKVLATLVSHRYVKLFLQACGTILCQCFQVHKWRFFVWEGFFRLLALDDLPLRDVTPV